MSKNKREKRRYTILIDLDTITTNEFICDVIKRAIEVFCFGLSKYVGKQTSIGTTWKEDKC